MISFGAAREFLSCNKKRIMRTFGAVVIAISAFAATSGSVIAAPPTTPCDPEYMQALEARAWLELNREITQNQNLIAKPDSVLEYTCFNRFLNVAAKNYSGGRPFSETTRWGAISGFSNTTTDTALSQTVGTALTSYITANFSHEYLGGRDMGADYAGMTGAVTGGDYNCSEMLRVWQDAKCMDFFEQSNRNGPSNKDGFMDFYWYQNAGNDPRDLPPGSACTGPASMYDTAINTAFNNGAPNRQADRYVLPAADDVDFNVSPYKVDNVVTHLDFILPVGTAPASSCQTIKTGITVVRPNVTPYDDAVCPNPGCYYDKNTCQP